MTLLTRILGGGREPPVPARAEPPVTRSRAETTVSSADIRSGSALWAAFTGGATGAPSEASALAVSAIYACSNLIAGAISALPMPIYRRDADDSLTVEPNHPLRWMLNEEFCARWSAAAGWMFLAKSRLLHGDAFAEILRGPGGAVRGLVPLHPDRVRVIPTPDGSRLVYEVAPDPTLVEVAGRAQMFRVLDQDDMVHVPGFGFDGCRGLSPLRYALRVAGRLAINAQDYAQGFLANSARPDLVLETDNELSDDQFARLRDMQAEHQGPANAGRPMILEGGLKVKPLTMPWKDMQLLETRQFSVEEIARIFGVPPVMIGHTSTNNYFGNGIDAVGRGFVRFTLREHLWAFHAEINRKFFARANRVAAFDTAELEQADFKTLVEGLRVALGRAGEPAMMTVQEARRVLRLKPDVDMPNAEPAPTPAPGGTQQQDGGQPT